MMSSLMRGGYPSAALGGRPGAIRNAPCCSVEQRPRREVVAHTPSVASGDVGLDAPVRVSNATGISIAMV